MRLQAGAASGGLEEGDGLDSGDLETLAAADVFAGDHIVAAHHIGLCLGEASAVALVRMTREAGFFVADEPAELVLGGLSAVGADEGVTALLRPLVKKIPLFHRLFPLRDCCYRSSLRL